MIKVSNLSLGFNTPEYIKILDNLDFVVAKGESVAIVGKSGTGKSSLLSLIAGISKAESGRIEINGIDIVNLNSFEITEFRSKNISTIFQDFKLISHLSVLENIMLPLEIRSVADQEQAMELIRKVGLFERKDAFPGTLSGGEKQRVAIARALCSKTDIILADEPNANLDIETGESVMNLLFMLVEEYQKTLLLVTHDSSLSSRCTSRYKLENFKLERLS